MSININKQPQILQPCYNQMIIAMTSSNMSKDSFQFVSDIYTRGELVSRIKTQVNPEGYGVVDIHRHIENSITYDFMPDSFGFNIATQSMATYSVIIGEEFRPIWEFAGNIDDGSGNVVFIKATQPDFNIGDEVVVQQDEVPVYRQYNGLATIVSINYNFPNWEVGINKPYLGNTLANSGNISLSKFRTIIIEDVNRIHESLSFNAVYDFNNFINYVLNDIKYDFLTEVPDNYELRLESRMFFNVYNNGDNLLDHLLIESDNGVYKIDNPYKMTSVDAQRQVVQVGVGPYELINGTSSITVISGTLPVLDNNTDNYSVRIRDINDNDFINKKDFIINHRCGLYENIQLIFLDRLGSFIPYTFTMKSKNYKNINRTNYQEFYGRYASSDNNWNYKTYNRGVKNLDTVVNEKYIINSDWIDEKTSDFLMTLFQSPEVYWINEDDLIQPINLKIDVVEKKKTINNFLINYKLEFELSNKSNSQRG